MQDYWLNAQKGGSLFSRLQKVLERGETKSNPTKESTILASHGLSRTLRPGLMDKELVEALSVLLRHGAELAIVPGTEAGKEESILTVSIPIENLHTQRRSRYR